MRVNTHSKTSSRPYLTYPGPYLTYPYKGRNRYLSLLVPSSSS